MKKMNIVKKLGLAVGLLGFAGMAQAGVITGWDMNNVTVTPGPYTEYVTYPSYLFTDTNKIDYHGVITWKETDVQAPGMKVVNGDDVDGSNCIMTTGYNPYDMSDKQCTDPLKSSKRWKVKAYENDVIDVYFEVADGATSIYRSLQKITDGTNVQWDGFRAELGFMVNGEFVKSTSDDGLGFSDTEGTFFTSTNNYLEIEETLSAMFAQGLAGPADKYHPTTGYYDPNTRFTFEIFATEDEIHTGAISSNYEALFGAWNNSAMVPAGYYWDDDGDINTDNLLMANCQGTFVVTDPIMETGYCDGTWVTYRSQEGLDPATGLPYPSDGVAKPVSAALLAAWQAAYPAYLTSNIDDLGNLGLNYWITVKDNTSWPTPNQFVIRYYPEPAAVEPVVEHCSDAIDNDGDGDIDCADSDCTNDVACTGPVPEVCDDETDNDYDGWVDCADSDCVAAANCQAPPAEICEDGIDNDGDGAIDCADADCAGVGICGPEGKLKTCSDGVDNDGDGAIDCADSGCAKNSACR